MRIDGLESNLDAKKPVKVATTGPITLSGFQTVDGVVLGTNDRILVKDQTDAVENGIYVASNGAWERAYDARDNRGVTSGLTVLVDGGSLADTQWALTTPNPNVGITNLIFKKTVDVAVLTRTSDGIPEGSNSLYFTQARARAAHSVAGSLSYNQSTGVISYTTPNSDGIVEGSTNKYYTDVRARASISVSGSLSYNSATGVISYTTPSTTGVAEGTNLYFTTARVRTSISAGGQLSYDNSTGIVSFTTLAVTGDGTIPAGGSVLTLANTGITAGTYTSLTVNAKGLVIGGKTPQYFTGQIAQTSGTTVIPVDNTQPLITEGTQLFSQTITPQSTASKVAIDLTFAFDLSKNAIGTAAVFRGSTFIACVPVAINSAPADPKLIAVSVVDSPASTSSQTYSVRFGMSTTGTWYLGRSSAATFGGTNPSFWEITEIL